jgi:hydrogenase maturation protease
MARGLVIALGHPDRGDDGAGPAVLARLRAQPPEDAVLDHHTGDALALLDLWAGAPWAVLLDAAVSGAAPGTLHRRVVPDQPLPPRRPGWSTHGLGLAEAVALGRSLNRLPGRLVVYALEAADVSPGAGLSPPVAAALEPAAARVRAEIARLDAEAARPPR